MRCGLKSATRASRREGTVWHKGTSSARAASLSPSTGKQDGEVRYACLLAEGMHLACGLAQGSAEAPRVSPSPSWSQDDIRMWGI